jgi:hypothetical protein
MVGDVAENEAATPDGSALRETVWVDYFADGGSFDEDRRLVSDASAGYQDDHAVEWTPPAEPGLVNVWAVVHDARGGASVVRRQIHVE